MNKDVVFMCEMQADFFSLANQKLPCSSPFFIARFMNSETTKELDNMDDYYNFISPQNLLVKMKCEYPSLKKEGKIKYPDDVMHWIGYVYRAWVTLKKRSSYKVYKIIDAEEMASLYNAFHTYSIDYCVERLEELALERKGPIKSDYQIFKEIMEQNN